MTAAARGASPQALQRRFPTDIFIANQLRQMDRLACPHRDCSILKRMARMSHPQGAQRLAQSAYGHITCSNLAPTDDDFIL